MINKELLGWLESGLVIKIPYSSDNFILPVYGGVSEGELFIVCSFVFTGAMVGDPVMCIDDYRNDGVDMSKDDGSTPDGDIRRMIVGEKDFLSISEKFILEDGYLLLKGDSDV